MTLINDYPMYNDPIMIKWRSNTSGDPYLPITESRKIVNNQTTLTEIPDQFSHVVITGYLELYEGVPASNQFIVNYSNGVITFNPSEAGKTVTCTYKGKGQILYPAERIYSHGENPNVVETLQEIIDSGEEAREALEQLNGKIIEANTAISDANNAATNANTQGTYAQTQGDYAKSSGDALAYKGNYAAGTAYVPKNMVFFNGATYMNILASTGIDPTNTTRWKRLGNMTWRGTYSTATTYMFGDTVIDATLYVVYISVADTNLNQALTNTTYWAKLIDVTSVVNAVTAATTAATTATTQANTARDNANTATAATNAAITSASTATTAANTATTQANAARDSANTAASAATAAAANANAFVSKGTYSSSTAYIPNNVVEYNGSGYVNIVASTGIAPTDTSKWKLIVMKGDQGSQGVQGAQGTGFTWRSTYASGTTYAVRDIVSYNGSTYICKSPTTGNLPTNSTYWDTFASKGNDGAGSVVSIVSSNNDLIVAGTIATPDLAISSSLKTLWGDKYTKAEVDSTLTQYLQKSGGVLTGDLTVSGANYRLHRPSTGSAWSRGMPLFDPTGTTAEGGIGYYSSTNSSPDYAYISVGGTFNGKGVRVKSDGTVVISPNGSTEYTVFHAGNHANTGDPHSQYMLKTGGTFSSNLYASGATNWIGRMNFSTDSTYNYIQSFDGFFGGTTGSKTVLFSGANNASSYFIFKGGMSQTANSGGRRISKFLGNVTTNPSGNNQKFDIYYTGDFSGYFDVTITGNWIGTNNAGKITKRFAINHNASGTLNYQDTKYVESVGTIAGNFAISNVTWDSANARWRIKIVFLQNATGYSEFLTVSIDGMTTDAVAGDNLANAQMGNIYTTDTAIYPAPYVQHTYIQSTLNQQKFMPTGGGKSGITNGTGTTYLLYADDATAGAYTYRSTLDDGSGNMSLYGTITVASSTAVNRIGSLATGFSNEIWSTHSTGLYINNRSYDGTGNNFMNTYFGNGKGAIVLTINGTNSSVSTKYNVLDDGSANSTFIGQMVINRSTNSASLELRGASSGWASGMLFNNTTASTGRKYGVYSSATGTFEITDETSTSWRMRFETTGDASFYGAGTFNGGIVSAHNNNIFRAGSTDHVYLALYARTASPTTRSAYIGYAGAATNNLTITNEISGGRVDLNTNGGYIFAGSDIQVQNAKNIVLNTGYLFMNMPTAAGGGWARGTMFYNEAGTTTLGMIGMYGAGTTVDNLFIGHGTSPYAGGTAGIRIGTNGSVVTENNVLDNGSGEMVAKGIITIDKSGGERQVRFTDNVTYGQGIYSNSGATGMYDWTNSRDVFAYMHSANTFRIYSSTVELFGGNNLSYKGEIVPATRKNSTSGKLEWHNGTAWSEVYGGSDAVIVASNTVRKSWATERTCANNGKILLAKFIPPGIGEMIISADYMRTSTTGNVAVTIVVEDTTSPSSIITNLDWRTPEGTSLTTPTGMNMGVNLGIESTSTYTTHTQVITITSATPIYIYGSMSSGSGNTAFFKNVTVSYDVITGGA